MKMKNEEENNEEFFSRSVDFHFHIVKTTDLPESDWRIEQGTFVMYHLFPNVQFLVSDQSATLIRIYPDREKPGRSTTQVTFYYSPEVLAALKEAEEAQAEAEAQQELGDVYDPENRRSFSVEASLEVFYSTIEKEDYAMGEMQQRAAETGMLKEVVFGRNEPALHHFHTSFRDALGLPPLKAA